MSLVIPKIVLHAKSQTSYPITRPVDRSLAVSWMKYFKRLVCPRTHSSEATRLLEPRLVSRVMAIPLYDLHSACAASVARNPGRLDVTEGRDMCQRAPPSSSNYPLSAGMGL